jgi:hypothetical protein
MNPHLSIVTRDLDQRLREAGASSVEWDFAPGVLDMGYTVRPVPDGAFAGRVFVLVSEDGVDARAVLVWWDRDGEEFDTVPRGLVPVTDARALAAEVLALWGESAPCL